MTRLLHNLWRRSPLGRLLEQRRRREEYHRKLERTRRAVDAAHDETRRRLRDWSTPLSAALVERIKLLDARWQRENRPDAVESMVELGRLEVAFAALSGLHWALWRLDAAARDPRCWVQDVRDADAAEAPAARGSGHRGRRANDRAADATRLAGLLHRLGQLDGRYQRLAADLPTSEQVEALTREVAALERAFRQLAEEAYPLWATRFPERARAAGDALVVPLFRRLLNQGQTGSAPVASDDGEFEQFDDEVAGSEDER